MRLKALKILQKIKTSSQYYTLLRYQLPINSRATYLKALFYRFYKNKPLYQSFFCRVKSPNFLNNCFATLDHYFRGNRFLYILIDGHTMSPMTELRIRSQIFPGADDQIRPICFFANPKVKDK